MKASLVAAAAVCAVMGAEGASTSERFISGLGSLGSLGNIGSSLGSLGSLGNVGDRISGVRAQVASAVPSGLSSLGGGGGPSPAPAAAAPASSPPAGGNEEEDAAANGNPQGSAAPAPQGEAERMLPQTAPMAWKQGSLITNPFQNAANPLTVAEVSHRQMVEAFKHPENGNVPPTNLLHPYFAPSGQRDNPVVHAPDFGV